MLEDDSAHVTAYIGVDYGILIQVFRFNAFFFTKPYVVCVGILEVPGFHVTARAHYEIFCQEPGPPLT